MPTTHVEPGSEALLQDIANSLWKAKKVVVITGAGISTNSGIPDFRSENGLYSLIQAQFDAAEKQAVRSDIDADADVSDSSVEEQPAKRRKPSPDRTGNDSQQGPVRHEEGESITVKTERERNAPLHDPESSDSAHDPPAQPATPRNTSDLVQDVAMRDVESSEHAPGPPGDVPERESELLDATSSKLPELPVLPSALDLTPLPSPRYSLEHIGSTGVASEHAAAQTNQTIPFVSSPPTLAIDALRRQSRPDLLDHRTRSSSPLSSPPPVSFDPYQESPEETTCSSSSQSGESSQSESEGPSSVSTPLLTSHTSFGSASGRTSLPNMKGRDLFDAQIWSCPVKTSVFYTFATTLRQRVRNAQPTSSHRFVSVLRDSRKLVRCYTQNIDQLEERVGLTTSLSLGAGSRYRFSVRSGRSSNGPRSSLKNQETSELSTDSQVLSQSTNEVSSQQQEAEAVVGSQTSSSQGPVDEPAGGQMVEKDEITGSSVSGPRLGPSTSTNEAPSSMSTAPALSSAAPAAPNRGVECVFLHGSLAELRCFVCARTATWEDEYRQSETLAGRQPTCPHCAGATAAREEKGKRPLGVGKLRPDIVLYGEEHPHSHLISPLVQHDLSLAPDMLLILGTSMRVHGLKVLVREFAKAVHDRGGKVVFVNFTKPPESVWADVLDYWVQWDCDAWVSDLQQRKPALWLPPGTVAPEEPKNKAPKASRRQNGGESGKKKEASDTTSKKRRESDGPGRKTKAENSNSVAPKIESSILVATEPLEVVKEIPRLRPEGPPRPRKMTRPKEAMPPPPLPELLPLAPPTAPSASPLPPLLPISSSFHSAPAIPSPLSMSMLVPPTPSAPEPLPPAQPSSASPPSLAVQPLPSPGQLHQPNAPVSSPSQLPQELGLAQPLLLPPAPKSAVRKPTKMAREVKLNPDAKRPASTRDHKLNGAFLTLKILANLKKISGEEPVPLHTPSPTPIPVRSKAKRARKSAPGTLESRRTTHGEDDEMKASSKPLNPTTKLEDVATRFSNDQEPQERPREATSADHDSSISAMVKTRKRKRAVAWRMVKGVETQVWLDENGDPIPPSQHEASLPRTDASAASRLQTTSLPHIEATFRPMSSGGFRTLPRPNPTPIPSPLGYPHYRSSNSLPMSIDDGFRETDRLIAKAQAESSRPSTPVQLAPIIIPDRKSMSQHKLDIMEPKVTSPGPLLSISSNVGSPVPTGLPNAFFLKDSLASQLSYPPFWLQQSRPPLDMGEHSQQHGRASYDSHASWCPDDQLRREEQEAAMALSGMRSGT
ncbi:putative NAD-dependent histone deacetylase [Podospora australis]|uniref:NAD-dependent histone deacetylase n=1 Tax=Podospora australis TaxID=1536484 RepID=A0AAN7AFJ0_9PEZI|nr:putative NAD-dependent histone deacetylase [Podospora australis]